jgi:hypothetical protein
VPKKRSPKTAELLAESQRIHYEHAKLLEEMKLKDDDLHREKDG